MPMPSCSCCMHALTPPQLPRTAKCISTSMASATATCTDQRTKQLSHADWVNMTITMLRTYAVPGKQPIHSVLNRGAQHHRASTLSRHETESCSADRYRLAATQPHGCVMMYQALQQQHARHCNCHGPSSSNCQKPVILLTVSHSTHNYHHLLPAIRAVQPPQVYARPVRLPPVILLLQLLYSGQRLQPRQLRTRCSCASGSSACRAQGAA